MLSALRSLLGRSAVFVDMRFRRIHYSDGAGCICVRLAGMGFDELTPEILSQYLRHAVANSVESFGYIMLDNEGGPVRDNDMITAALEYAATVPRAQDDGPRSEPAHRGQIPGTSSSKTC